MNDETNGIEPAHSTIPTTPAEAPPDFDELDRLLFVGGEAQRADEETLGWAKSELGQ